MESEDILYILEILEDQMFLLNMVKLYSCENQVLLSDCISQRHSLFLHPSEVIKAKESLALCLLKTPLNDDLMISCLMRGLSVCVALLAQVFCNSTTALCNTVSDFDNIVGHECKYMWTRTSCDTLLAHLERALSFLCFYGSLFQLPSGVWSFHSKCHLCLEKKHEREINDSLQTGVGHSCEFCPHLLRNKLAVPCDIGSVDKINDIENLLEEASQSQNSQNLFPMLAGSLKNTLGEVSLSSKTHILGFKMQLVQKQGEIKEVKNKVLALLDNYKNATLKKTQVIAPKCLNTTCYKLVGQITLLLIKRLSSIWMFSPMNSSIKFFNAFSIINLDRCATQLQECLKRVVLQKVNNKLIQQKYEQLLVDPFSLKCGSSNILRHSIIAKKFMLTYGNSARELCNISRVWDHLTTSFVLENKMHSQEERMLKAVYIVLAFNHWLSQIHVHESFHLQLYRSDVTEKNWEGVVLLYDFEQVGLNLPDGSKMHSNYNNILHLCVGYLFYLYRSGVCRNEPSVWQILNIKNPN